MSTAINPNLLAGLGCALATFLSAAGSAVATAHGSIYAMNMTQANSPGVYGYIKAFVPVIISGVLAIYGLIISYLLVKKFNDDMTTTEGARYLSAGLSVGLACLASGWGISLFLKQLNGKATRKEAPSCPAAPSGGSAPETFVDENSSPLSEPLVPTSGSVDVYSDTSFIKMVLSLVFLEAIGLYGHIVALLLIA